jgi:UDP-N-acetylglucosamine--N-acetylmuramyl-(pentapeptide) pyrophosphoryl-undecaprenol N-acetylglucosamine transferase
VKILLAGGGTAGHIEPALAVARSLKAAHPAADFLFLGTPSGLESRLIPEAGFKLSFIEKVLVPRRASLSLFRVPWQLWKAIRQSYAALSGVAVAIGFGGYVSAPLYLAARLRRIPFVIHEQNARPGWANRLGAYLTPHVALTYPVKSGSLKKGLLTGLPLRQDVLNALEQSSGDWSQARANARSRISSRYKISEQKPLIFIFGGSQGSQKINSVIADSREFFRQSNVAIVHGVGRGNPLPERDHDYLALDYITDMADLYLAADLIIARSGAVTCAEVDALARFALFIPLPIGNGEQALNAAPLVAKSRAITLDQGSFSPHWLMENLNPLLEKSAKSQIKGNDQALSAVGKISAMVMNAMEKR